MSDDKSSAAKETKVYRDEPGSPLAVLRGFYGRDFTEREGATEAQRLAARIEAYGNQRVDTELASASKVFRDHDDEWRREANRLRNAGERVEIELAILD